MHFLKFALVNRDATRRSEGSARAARADVRWEDQCKLQNDESNSWINYIRKMALTNETI